MAITADRIERISHEVIKVLFSRFESFPEDASKNRNAPFHKAFLNAFQNKFEGKVSDIPFFVSLSSWMHGLNTTLGQTFFENVAHILSNGEKREYTSKKLGNLEICETQRNNINLIISDLSTSSLLPNLTDENNKIFIDDQTELVKAIDFSADVFIDDGESILAIEMKTVKPNSGEMRGEKQKILNGKAALFKKFPNHKIYFFLGFPFDPTNTESDVGFNKERFCRSVINLNKYFSIEEILIAEELWDTLSGEHNTMRQILEIINSIATPDFMAEYNFLNDQQNKFASPAQYEEILRRWNLKLELELFRNDKEIKSRIGKNNLLLRVYNQMIFDKDGRYNRARYETLSTLYNLISS